MRHAKTLLTLVVVAAVAGPAAADWRDGDYAKWVQLPDLDPTGIDIKATTPKVLADDFPCEEAGYITQVHIWGSWKGDILPEFPPVDGDLIVPGIPDPAAVSFRISFHDNIQADPIEPDDFSRPLEPPLWEALIPVGAFQVIEGTVPVEGWYDPNDEFSYDPDDHQMFYLYNFDLENLLELGMLYDPSGIEIKELFWQEGDAALQKIYWLDIEAFPNPGDGSMEDPEFGWKTRTLLEDQWMDDAVWKDVDGAWRPLVYPLGHELEGVSLDLAFVIVPEPATLALLAIGGSLALLRRRRRR